MANVTFDYNPQPAPACYPPDSNALLAMLTTGGGLSGTIPDNSGGGIYVGSAPPSSSLTNKVWYKVDAAGRPLGVFMFYNGSWRPVYTGQLGDIKAWGGNPSGLFDGTGRGVIGQMMDGWALCNGQNGTYNLTDRFIVGGTWNAAAGWETNADAGVTGGGTLAGGAGTVTIAPNNLPALQVPTFGVLSGPVSGGGGAFLGAENAVFQNYWHLRDGSGNPITGANTPYTNCPPYYAMAWIQFVGFQ